MVLFTAGPMTYVGRWDAIADGNIVLIAATSHREGDRGLSRQQFLEQLARTGPPFSSERLAIDRSEVTEVRKLGDLAREMRAL